MNIFRLAFELFMLYPPLQIIFDFIIPLVNTTREVKKQFGDMNARMQQMNEQQRRQATAYNEKNQQSTAYNDKKEPRPAPVKMMTTLSLKS